MARVLFVDDRPAEVMLQWKISGCESDGHVPIPIGSFEDIEQTCLVVKMLQPEVVLVGYGLGKPEVTGADVIRSLRQGGYTGYIIANSGGGAEQFERAGVEVNGSANRDPHNLKRIMDNLFRKEVK